MVEGSSRILPAFSGSLSFRHDDVASDDDDNGYKRCTVRVVLLKPVNFHHFDFVLFMDFLCTFDCCLSLKLEVKLNQIACGYRLS